MVEVPPELQSVSEEALCVFVDPLVRPPPLSPAYMSLRFPSQSIISKCSARGGSPLHDSLLLLLPKQDGTREFVEGRLDAVQTLIGVSLYGRAVAVRCLPPHASLPRLRL